MMQSKSHFRDRHPHFWMIEAIAVISAFTISAGALIGM